MATTHVACLNADARRVNIAGCHFSCSVLHVQAARGGFVKSLSAHCNFRPFDLHEKCPVRSAERQQLKMMDRRIGDLSLLPHLASGSKAAACKFHMKKGAWREVSGPF